jgi:hypothetical protein
VKAGCQAVKTEMWGKISVVVLLPKQVHMQHEGGHGVRIFRELHTSSTIVIVEFHLGLKPKEEEIGLSKVENIFDIQPDWSMDRYRRVKTWDSKFKDAPQVILPVI